MPDAEARVMPDGSLMLEIGSPEDPENGIPGVIFLLTSEAVL